VKTFAPHVHRAILLAAFPRTVSVNFLARQQCQRHRRLDRSNCRTLGIKRHADKLLTVWAVERMSPTTRRTHQPNARLSRTTSTPKDYRSTLDMAIRKPGSDSSTIALNRFGPTSRGLRNSFLTGISCAWRIPDLHLQSQAPGRRCSALPFLSGLLATCSWAQNRRLH